MRFGIFEQSWGVCTVEKTQRSGVNSLGFRFNAILGQYIVKMLNGLLSKLNIVKKYQMRNKQQGKHQHRQGQYIGVSLPKYIGELLTFNILGFINNYNSMLSTVKHTQKQLKTTIVYERVGDIQLYYSMCKKEAALISIISNQRLFVFDQTNATLFYINEIKATPFRTEDNLPKPKGDYCPISLAIIKVLPKTSTLNILFNKKDEKGKLIVVDWNFTMETTKLANEWMKFLQESKRKLTAKALGLNQNDQGASVINDTLAYGMLSKQKGQDAQQKKDNQQLAGFFMGLSKQKQDTSKEKDSLKKSEIKDSNVNQSNLKGSNVKQSNLKDSNVKQSNLNSFNAKQSGIQKSNVKQTNLKNSNTNQQLNQSSIKNDSFKQSGLKDSGVKQTGLKSSNIKQSDVKDTKQSEVKNEGQNSFHYFANSLSSKDLEPKGSKSAYKGSTPYQKDKDWNKRFLRDQQQTVISEFEEESIRVFMNLLTEDLEIQDNQIKEINKEGLILRICQVSTFQAQKLKNQFKNYHYLLEIGQDQMYIHVPMTCIISYLGLICLVKAPFPQNPKQVTNTRDLEGILRKVEHQSKISSSIWRKNGVFYDLTTEYGNQTNQHPIIFVDDLMDYLPIAEEGNAIRPEIIRYMRASSLQYSSSLTVSSLNDKRSQILQIVTDLLSTQEVIITNYTGLKQFLHTFGLNINSLPRLYQNVTNRKSKRILHTAMIAKIIVKQIQQQYCNLHPSQWKQAEELTERMIKLFLEGGNRNGEEVWKEVALTMKKKYRVSLNPHQIEGGFLLSSLASLLNLSFYIDKINKQKQLVVEPDIFGEGFIKEINPKTKIYYKFRTLQVENKLKTIYKSSDIEDIEKIVSSEPRLGDRILSLHMRMEFYSRISKYLNRFSNKKQIEQLHKEIYSNVNKEPVSIFTHEITMQFLSVCLRNLQTDLYKETINTALQNLIYWCGEDHTNVCDIYESLSDFYAIEQSHQDSIDFMKQALTTCVRSGGTHTRKSGIKYFQLGCKQMIFGFKNEAYTNLLKAKSNMESFEQKTEHYPLMLSKLAILELNKGQLDSSIVLTLQVLKQSESIPIDDPILIKSYLSLSRAYEIKKSIPQLANLGHLCAKVFNNTRDKYTFDQMIRICIVSSVIAMPTTKRQKLAQYLQINNQKESNSNDAERAIDDLMMKAKSCLIMQKFMGRLGHIDKVMTQIKSNRGESNESRQTKWIINTVLTVVGHQFVEGTILQASYIN